MMYGNNEIGNRLPIAEVGAILKNHSAIFHTDAVKLMEVKSFYLMN